MAVKSPAISGRTRVGEIRNLSYHTNEIRYGVYEGKYSFGIAGTGTPRGLIALSMCDAHVILRYKIRGM